MTRHTGGLGDGPIEAKQVELMNATAKALDFAFNGDARGKDRQTGFVLLTFDFNSHDGRCNFISNGADRQDIVTLFKEMIARFEGQPQMKGGMMADRRCQLCGCTELDACTNMGAGNCWWVNENTCSHCLSANTLLERATAAADFGSLAMVMLPRQAAHQLLKMSAWAAEGAPARVEDVRLAVADLQGQLEALSP